MRISYTSRIMQAILLVVVLLAFIGNTVSAKAEINSIEASLFSQNDIADNTIENLNSFHLLAFSELAYRDWEKGQTVYENLKDDWDKPAFSPNSIASELSTIQKDYSYGNLFVSNTKGTILYKELCKDISDWVVVGTSKFPPKQLSMYQYHPGFYAVTFQGQTQNGQKTVIAFRGSTTQNKDDTINDWLENDFPFQLTHLYTDQLSLAQWYYEVCISDLEINCDDIVVTGHSLGGALATAVSIVNGVYAEVFNSASAYEALAINQPELVASHFSGVDKWNLLSHIVIGDVVSNWNNEYTHLPYVEHRLSDNSITKAHNLSTFLRYIDNGGSKGVTFLVSSPVSSSSTPTAANPNDLPLFLGTSGNDDVVCKPVRTLYNSKAVILGGDGDDTLVSACDSDDMLFGGNATNYDFLDGGKGNDKYFYYKGNGIHIIQNESGHDSVFLYNFSETDLIEFVSDESFEVVACNGVPIIYVAGTRNSKSSVDVVLVQKTSWGQEEYTLVELKKSPYRFTQPNMTLEALTHSIQEGKENTFITEKRLTQADVCFENGNNWHVRLNYNENGLLTGYTQDSYTLDNEVHYSFDYTYNSDGKLTQSREILSGFPCSKYYYDNEGKMTGWEYWEFSWSDGKVYTCEYNASGQRIRDISTNGKDETLYSYDDLGRLISVSSRWGYGDMSGTDEATMTYDEYGNLIKKEILSDSGVGFPSMQTFLYSYDHFPFVHVTVYRDGELMYSCLDYNAMSADERVSFTIDNTAKFESEEGYLVKVKGEDCEWNFSYMQENTLPVLGVSDSENQAGEENTSLRVIREASVGDYVTYGAYEQDNDLTNGQEPIEWLVLDREGDRVLLLSRFGLDAQPYNTVNMDVTWEKSSIRSWLNETFLRNAFSVEEQQFILKTNVDNSKSQGYYAWSTSGGNGTQDKIFLLSYSEANKFLGVTDSARENIISQVLPTDYAKARGAYSGAYPPDSDKTDSAVIGWWWLRSPGFKQYAALCVNVGGSVSFYSEVGKTAGCIRPAFWISIK